MVLATHTVCQPTGRTSTACRCATFSPALVASFRLTQVLLATLEETPVAAKVLVPLRRGPNGLEAAGTLNERQLEKFHRECSLLASVRHPNIVQVRGMPAGLLHLASPPGCCCRSCAHWQPKMQRKSVLPFDPAWPSSPPALVQIMSVCEDPPTIIMGEARCAGAACHPSGSGHVRSQCHYDHHCTQHLVLSCACTSCPAFPLYCPPTRCRRVLQQGQPAGCAAGGARLAPPCGAAELAAPPGHGAGCGTRHPVSWQGSAGAEGCTWRQRMHVRTQPVGTH